MQLFHLAKTLNFCFRVLVRQQNPRILVMVCVGKNCFEMFEKLNSLDYNEKSEKSNVSEKKLLSERLKDDLFTVSIEYIGNRKSNNNSAA